jgi:hypothetical protein
MTAGIVLKVPFKPALQQKLKITMNGIQYNITLRWIHIGSYWCIDIADSNDNRILSGIPLVTGADLLDQFEYLNLGSDVGFMVYTNAIGHSPDEIPTFTNLGVESHLYFVTKR